MNLVGDVGLKACRTCRALLNLQHVGDEFVVHEFMIHTLALIQNIVVCYIVDSCDLCLPFVVVVAPYIHSIFWQSARVASKAAAHSHMESIFTSLSLWEYLYGA